MKSNRIVLDLREISDVERTWQFPHGMNTRKLCSILELKCAYQHNCVLSCTGQYLTVLEDLEERPNVTLSSNGNQTTRKQGSCQVWLLDLKSGCSSQLEVIPGPCTDAVYHPTDPIVAVLHPPSTLHLYHLETRQCTEVVQCEGVEGPLIGLHWARDGLGHDNVNPATLVCHTSNDVILLRPPRPARRLIISDTIVWASLVEGRLCVVVQGGAVEVWLTDGGRQHRIEPPAAQTIICATVVNGIVVMAGSCPRFLVCHVALGHTVAVQSPVTTAIAAITATTTAHPLHKQVLLVLDVTRALHIVCLDSNKRLKMLHSPKLPIISMSASTEWVTLSYSNGTTKLYPLPSLLPTVDVTAPPSQSAASNVLPRAASSHPPQEACKLHPTTHQSDLRVGLETVETSLTVDPSSAQAPGTFSENLQSTRIQLNNPQLTSLQSLKDEKNICLTDENRETKKLKKVAAGKVQCAASMRGEWQLVLSQFGELPGEQRCAVWCGLLQLPRCAAVHAALHRKQTHSAVQQYDAMTDGSLRGAFRGVLSCLYHWAPSLSAVSWLPSFVFPFVKVMKGSPLVCFELCVTLLVSWCRVWFTDAAVTAVDSLVGASSPRLLARLVGLHVTARDTYAWPIMTTALAQVLSPDEWLVAWDHVLSEPPSFLLCMVAALTLSLQSTIMAANSDKQIQLLYSQETYVPVKTILKKARQLHNDMPLASGLVSTLDHIVPFPKGGLPIFDNIPENSNGGECDFADPSATPTAEHWMTDNDIIQVRRELYEREKKLLANINALRRRPFT